MNTVLTTSPFEAAEFIKRGGLVAFPTETVYGLGANVFDARAIKRIFRVKKRPGDNPLIAHVASLEQIDELTAGITTRAEKFINAFFPGPLTVVLRKSGKVPMIATGNLETIGVRMPRLELARDFLRACGTPVVAPSANISGRPSPTTWKAVAEDMYGKIECFLQGEPTEIGLESTVVDCTEETPLLLRQGAVSLEDLRKVVADTRVFKPAIGGVIKSPGLKHRHYSPQAKVRIFHRDLQIADPACAAYIGLNKQKDFTFKRERVYGSIDEYAHNLFHVFRKCDSWGVEAIYCEPVEEKGIGAALMDRIRRAAQS